MKERIGYIDAAKAVAITLVILGHCDCSCVPYLSRFIWSFHMPLFFLISGMFIRPRPVGEALRKYGRAYLVPYFLVSLIGISIVILLQPGLAKDCVVGLLWGSHDLPARYFGLGHDVSCGPQWFLFALFSGCMAYSLISKIDSALGRWMAALSIASIGIIVGRIYPLPFSICQGALVVVYLMIGSEIRRLDLVNRFCRLPKLVIGLCLVAWFVVVGGDGLFDMGSLRTGGIAAALFTIIASLVVLSVLRNCSWDGGWIGRSTLAVLCGHVLLLSYLLPAWGNPSFAWTDWPVVNLAIQFAVNLMGALILAFALQRIPFLGRFFRSSR